MDHFNIKYHQLDKILLCAIGLWPYQGVRERRIRGIITIVTISSLATVVGLAFLKADWSIDVFAEIIPPFTTGVIAVVKYLAWSYYRTKMRVLLECVNQDWNDVKSREEYTILREINDEGRLYNVFFARFIYACSFLFNFSPLSSVILDIFLPLNQSRALEHPYKADYYVDPHKHFYPILFHMYFVSTVIMTILISTDLFYINKLHHACGLFRLAGYQINAALTANNEEYYVQDSKQMLGGNFAHGVEYHKKAIKFSGTINDFYEWIYFILIMLFAISLSTSLCCVALSVGRWKDATKNLLWPVAQIGYLFIIMYPCQKLLNDSADILGKTYSSQWYSAPIRTQKLMIIVLQKCLTPSTISVGKMITLSMESYSVIIQTSISYFMALFSLR